jgi:putative peptide zinc metalloprotease protein
MTATPVAPNRTGTSNPEVPVRAEGVHLIGELPGSGYKQPPSLVRRADGQTVQLTRLLFLVLDSIDGHRSLEDVADRVSDAFGRQVSAAQVAELVDGQLRPLGLLQLADGTEPAVRTANPLLNVRLKKVVTDPAVTRRITAPFAVLFHPLVVIPFVLAFTVTAGWVLFHEGLAAAAHDAFTEPGLFLLVFALTALSAGFHEFGHAAACRYGGATPGAMGAGLYLVWPAFYTEVGDSYRLGRGGRVRVDLGGLYFNALFAVAMFAVWAGTHWEALLLIIAAQVLQMLRQLAPLVRFDGYHILADLTGVPDLYSHIKPTLAGLLPHRWRRPSALTWWARTVVTAWVLLVLPLLLVSVLMMVVTFPRAAATAWASVVAQSHVLSGAWSAGDPAEVAVRLLSIAALALPVLAMTYLLARLLRRTVASVRRSTAGHPGRRAVAVLAAVALLGGLAWAWWPGDSYRPIRPNERGTVFDAVPASLASRLALPRTAASVPAPPRLHEGDTGQAQTLWVGDQPPPPKDQPQLSLVLVPADPAAEPAPAAAAGPAATEAAPTWVFPFNRPAPPGPGDNQALAVNTTDGSIRYDVAFALVWADDGDVLNTNEAYALAHCSGCASVAVAFQVVLVLGQADVVIPQNLAAAVNYGCVQCVTYALAQQLVLTLDGPLSEAGMSALEAVWTQIQQFGQTIGQVPLSQIQATLAGYEQQIVDIVQAESAGQTPTPSPPTSSGQPTGTGTPTGPAADPTTSDGTTPTSGPTDSTAGTATASPDPTTAPASEAATGGSTAAAISPTP